MEIEAKRLFARRERLDTKVEELRSRLATLQDEVTGWQKVVDRRLAAQ